MTRISADVLADSVRDGRRLTTLLLTYPRHVHAQVMSHRMCSRNSASSRAIPTRLLIKETLLHPALPLVWGRTKRGMSMGEELPWPRRWACRMASCVARLTAAGTACVFRVCGLHKEAANTVLESYLHITTVVTSTDWHWFLRLRDADGVQPETRELARGIRRALGDSTPRELRMSEWHTPFLPTDRDARMTVNTALQRHADEHFRCIIENRKPPEDPHAILEDLDLVEVRCRVAIARCARLSYNKQYAHYPLHSDLALFERLLRDRHLSPFEHVVTPGGNPDKYYGPYLGWESYRRRKLRDVEYEKPPKYGSIQDAAVKAPVAPSEGVNGLPDPADLRAEERGAEGRTGGLEA